MKRARPFHVFLFAGFPVLFLFAQNADELALRDLTRPLLISVAGSIALLFVMSRILRDAVRAGLVSSAIIILFFSYGHVWEILKGPVIGGRIIGGWTIDSDLYLLIPWAAICLGVLLIAIGARKYLNESTQILNVVALTLVLMSTFSILRSGGDPPASKGDCPQPLTQTASVTAKQPRDIYYLIFDRYGGAPTLKNTYGYDNSEFLAYLEDKGFYVASDSRANYPRTGHSLASSLNANYLDCLTERVSKNESNWGAVHDSLQDHQVGRFLQRAGYTYAHIGSWWDVTAKSPYADEDHSFQGSLGFSRLLYSLTLARPFGEYLGLSDPWRLTDYRRALLQLRTVRSMPQRPGPRFVFAHFLLPHEPYIFDAEGNYRPRSDEQRLGLRRSYIDQLVFTNRALRELLDVLLSGPEETRPIVVLQSDEGPHPVRYDIEGPDFDWTKASSAELNETFRILNAYYLPGITDPGLYPTITPVNTFRKIFDLYLGTHFGPLPDEAYVYADDDHPYRFERVTERLWERVPSAAAQPGG
jgi:hypothetical protein